MHKVFGPLKKLKTTVSNYHYFLIAARAISATMSAEEFLANVEGGIVPVACHEDVLRFAFIYLDEGLWTGNGVFDVVEKLHAHGLSFGEGYFRFNRSLDIFYLAQLAAAIYRYSSQLEDDFLSFSDFPALYTALHTLLHSLAWRSYYSTPFLTQRTTARFYRLPDLQDLPDVREWHGVWPGAEERGKMLRRILVENAQLFARWRVSPISKQFTFELGPRG